MSSTTEPRPRPRQRRAMGVGFGVSAALHLIAVLLYPILLPRAGPPSGTPSASTARPRPEGIEVVRIVEVPDAVAPAATTPERAPPAVSPAPPSPDDPVPAPVGAPPGAAPAEPGAPSPDPPVLPGDPTAAERLRPRIGDLRIWTLDPSATELSVEQLVELDLIWAIATLNDSAAAAAAAERRLTDWTYTDESGKRWGVADGKIYLGDIVLPFPFGFGSPVSPGSAEAWRAWMDREIDRAAGNAAARENLQERIRAIRERLDRERRQPRDSSSARPPGGG